MHTLITGGTGLIGTSMTAKLLAAGDTVTLFDRDPPTERIERLRDAYPDRLDTVTGDILDVELLASCVDTGDVDAIVHLAYALGAESNADAPLATRVNVDGTVNVLELARRCGVRRVVMASSIAVYGDDAAYPPDQLPLTEGVPLHTAAPLPVYAAGKIYLEKLAQHYRDQHGLLVVGMRPSIIYGWGRRSGATSWLSALIERPARGEPCHLDSGDALVSLVYVDDVAEQFIALLRANAAVFTDTFFFNTGGDTCRVGEAAEVVRRLLPDARIEVTGDGERNVHGLAASVSDEAMRRVVGHERRFTPLEVAFSDYIETVRAEMEVPT